MKSIITILLLTVFISSNSQDLKINVAEDQTQFALKHRMEQLKAEGMTYIGSGEYQITDIGSTGFSQTSKILKNTKKQIEKFAKTSKATYEILNIQEFKTVIPLPKVIVNFRLLDENGMPMMTKDEAKKELMDLKELLDLGIISQQEFDDKAKELKAIFLRK